MTGVLPNKHRDITFDIMKGIGIVLVMTCHFFGWNHPWLARVILSFHMPMFFIVAGYFSKSYSEVTDKWTAVMKYAKRLWLPYLFVMFITMSWFCLMGVVKSDWGDARRELFSLFWAEATPLPTNFGALSIGVVWFLLALFWAKVYLLLLSKWENLLLPLSLLLSMGALILHGIFPYIPWCLLMGFMALPFVVMGWWVRRNQLPMWWIKFVSVVAWALAIVFVRFDMYTYTWEYYPLGLLGACGGTWMLYLLCRWIAQNLRLTARVFAQLGMASLAIMCFHCFELSSHLGNHLKALVGLELPTWGLYLWRYGITILLAILVIHTPKLKNLFV